MLYIASVPHSEGFSSVSYCECSSTSKCQRASVDEQVLLEASALLCISVCVPGCACIDVRTLCIDERMCGVRITLDADKQGAHASLGTTCLETLVLRNAH